ncbi:uncharacterized protein LOC124263953 [Haliotis rubra]|uniref:uncharacterized protein LOC124263953 n=1 Tax=Haliotis rubra TaxID=36100 RepID=UPI001EE4F586|nr:uncharacterized protein LOC124263953 [Haliotis rubra]
MISRLIISWSHLSIVGFPCDQFAHQEPGANKTELLAGLLVCPPRHELHASLHTTHEDSRQWRGRTALYRYLEGESTLMYSTDSPQIPEGESTLIYSTDNLQGPEGESTLIYPQQTIYRYLKSVIISSDFTFTSHQHLNFVVVILVLFSLDASYDRSESFWDPIKVNDISWNFEKLLIDHNGRPLFRFRPDVEPMDLEELVELMLTGPWIPTSGTRKQKLSSKLYTTK